MIKDGLTAGLNDHTPPPGMYPNVRFEGYDQWTSAIRQSDLKHALRSARHYQHAIANPRKDTDALRAGRFFHAIIDRPANLLRYFAVAPEDEWKAKIVEARPEIKNWKATTDARKLRAEWEKAIGDKQVIDQETLEQFEGIAGALAEHPTAHDLLSAKGESELSIAWKDIVVGPLCRGRIDRYVPERKLFIDLKTTSADVCTYEKELLKYGTHIQMAYYADGLFTLTGETFTPWLVVVESTPPHAVRCAPMSEDALSVGRFLYRRALRVISEAQASGCWKHPPDPVAWDIPQWGTPSIELTQGGQPLITL